MTLACEFLLSAAVIKAKYYTKCYRPVHGKNFSNIYISVHTGGLYRSVYFKIALQFCRLSF